MKTRKLGFGSIAGGLLVATFWSGCTFPSRSEVYDRRQVGRIQTIEMGTVEGVKAGVIAGQRSAIGTLGGAATGVAATGGVGHGVGQDMAQAGGGIAGAIVGEAVQEAVTRKEAEELTIRLDNGNSIVLIQEQSMPPLIVGERVKVLSGGLARVVRP